MKNELGIEVKCDNCWFRLDCDDTVRKTCKKNGLKTIFKPSIKAYKSRIKELQKVMREEADAIDLGVSALNKHYEEQIQRLKKQVFTWDELNLIKSIIIEVKRVNHLRYYGFHPTPLLNKIERILNNEQ